jgi:hypothetical protein
VKGASPEIVSVGMIQFAFLTPTPSIERAWVDKIFFIQKKKFFPKTQKNTKKLTAKFFGVPKKFKNSKI